MEIHINKYWQPIFLAFILCMFYVMPKTVSILTELLFFIILWVKNNDNHKRGNKLPLLWYAIFACLLFATNIFRIDNKSFSYLSTCINNLLFVYIAVKVVKCKQDVDVFLKSFGMMGLAFCVILIPTIEATLTSGGLRLGWANMDSDNEFLSDPIRLGYILMMINICQFYLLVDARNKRWKFFAIALFSFSLFCILLTGTRKAVLASILCILFYVFVYNKSSFFKLSYKLLLYVFLFFALYEIIIYNDVLYETIGKRIEGLLGFLNNDYAIVDDSTTVRSDLIKKGVDIFLEAPLFGLGVQKTQDIIRLSHPHNNYLSCLDFGGVVTFIAYYWFYIKIIINYINIGNREKIDTILLGVMVAILMTDYTATTYNIIFFPTFITVIYLNGIYKYQHLKQI